MSNQCNFLVKDNRSPYQQNLHHTSDNIYPKYYLKYPSYFINYIQLLFVTLHIYKKKILYHQIQSRHEECIILMYQNVQIEIHRH